MLQGGEGVCKYPSGDGHKIQKEQKFVLIFCFRILIQISSPLLWPFKENTNSAQPHPVCPELENAICIYRGLRMLWFCTGTMCLYPCSVLKWCNFRQHCSQATHWSHSHSSWSIRCCSLLSPVPAAGASPQHQHPVLDWRNAPSTRPQ